MLRITLLAGTCIALISCGDESPQAAMLQTSSTNGQGDPRETLSSSMELYETRNSLPICNASIENAMAYVSDEKRLYACSDSLWKAADLQTASTTTSNQARSMSDIQPLSVGSTQCSKGGVLVIVGNDTNNDGILSSIESTKTQAVCNGAEGKDGKNGVDGEDGAGVYRTYRYNTNSYTSSNDLATGAFYDVYIGTIQVVWFKDNSYTISVAGTAVQFDTNGDVYTNDFSHFVTFGPSQNTSRSYSVKLDSYLNNRMLYRLNTSGSAPTFSAAYDTDTNDLNNTFKSYSLTWE